MAAGVAYFGNRILRHVAADMEDIAARGFTAVLHTFSEHDLHHYARQMTRIVAASHAAGLEVQVSPWGLAGIFGGEATSHLLAQRPDLGQVLQGGGPVGAACLSRPEVRAYVHRWIDAAVASGADGIVFDEPQWARPDRFDRPAASWGCVCDTCRAAFRERHGHDLPRERTAQVAAFHGDVLVDVVRDIVGYAAAQGARCTVNLLPDGPSAHDADVWAAVAASPGLHGLSTDPAWVRFGEEVVPFVGTHASRLVALADGHGLVPHLWIQGFGIGPQHVDEVRTAVGIARDAGVEHLWTWGYEACGHMTGLGTRNPDLVWEALTEALTGRSRPTP